VSSFCRHGTLTESCPICRVNAENDQRLAAQRAARPATQRRATGGPRSRALAGARSGTLTIRREARSADDGFRSALAPGLRSTADAERLAEELGRASGRLAALASEPPGLYAEVASEPDIEEASWLGLLIAYVGPLDGVEDPFATIRAVRTSWRSGELPDLAEAQLGPRSPHTPERGDTALVAYRRWAERAGSQAAAFNADPNWTAGQRFERAFERLTLPGLDRRTRYDLLAVLGALGRYELAAPSLLLSEDDPVTRAAKRVFGIGDRLTLERRTHELAQAAGVTIAAFDLALDNWAAAEPTALGVGDADDESVRASVAAALGC